MTARPRLLMAISSMRAGGAERVAAILSEQWVRDGCGVTLVTTTSSAQDFYATAPEVERVPLQFTCSPGSARAALRCARIVFKLRQAIRQARPDAVISLGCLTNLMCLAAVRGLGIPVIISERSDPRQYSLGRVWETLRTRLYPSASCIIAQTQSVREWARRFMPPDRVSVIGNPLSEWATTARRVERRNIVAGMGRLSREKGFDILIRAFAEFAPRYPDWRLRIIGDGVERAALTRLAADSGIGAKVEFTGIAADPLPLLNDCSIFALPSRYEGYPNALLEAMGIGLAAVAADCPSGPREMIDHGETGLLLPPENPAALAGALSRLAASPQERERLGRNGQRVRQATNNAAAIAQRWLDCVTEVRHNGMAS